LNKLNRYKIIITVVLLVIILISIVLYVNDKDQLIYVYKDSIHHGFYIDNGYVIFHDEIKIKNVTSKDLCFYMYADVSEDAGLVNESKATACYKDSLLKQTFIIKANSEQIFIVYFRVKAGDKKTKTDRLPPDNIDFEILK
jgi:hypothetical protein